MSYDLSFGVMVCDPDKGSAAKKVYEYWRCEDGTDLKEVEMPLIKEIDVPAYDSPTYNLRSMFVACTGWDYHQSCWYRVKDVLPHIVKGISELELHRKKYEKYNPPNGWGDVDAALKCLRSIADKANELSEDIPIECLFLRW